MDLPKLDFLKGEIPIPDPKYITSLKAGTKDGKLIKYEGEYEKFCKWSSLPSDERVPKTAEAFEKKYSLPRFYTSKFKDRVDFRSRVVNYFWDWMMDKFPDVVQSMYKRAVAKDGSSADAKYFAELVSKHLEVDKPIKTIQPFVLVGVDQNKINKLFTPQKYEKIIDGEVK